MTLCDGSCDNSDCYAKKSRPAGQAMTASKDKLRERCEEAAKGLLAEYEFFRSDETEHIHEYTIAEAMLAMVHAERVRFAERALRLARCMCLTESCSRISQLCSAERAAAIKAASREDE